MNKKETEMEIMLDSSCFENQRNRLIVEFDISKEEAERISNTLKDLVETELKKQGKKWSEDTIGSFTNLMIAILIEEAKILYKLKLEE